MGDSVLKNARLFLLLLIFGSGGLIACDSDTINPSTLCQWLDAEGVAKQSECKENQGCCAQGCTLLSIDTQNCGKCGITCEADEVCRNAACIDRDKEIPAGDAIICNGVEVVPSKIGMFDCTRCMAGRADCNDNLTDGCEADLQALNMKTCSDCRPNYGNCNDDPSDGCELNLLDDALNCGACDAACGDSESCYRGSCVTKCMGDEAFCLAENGVLQCRDLKNDPSNCGGCDRQCESFDGTSVACQNGTCVYTCDAGQNCSSVDLEPICTQLQTDAKNCGACGHQCQTAKTLNVNSATCSDGSCELQCQKNFGDCDNDPTNGCEQSLRFDAKHCGACNNTCAAPNVCIEGSCCQKQCNGKTCGSDGCGGLCGECPTGQDCNALGNACIPIIDNFGCSDGSREGYLDIVTYDKIAACGGAWNVPGIHHNEGPNCGRAAGNTGTNRMGTGCNVEDLCAEGWHVCLGKNDLKSRTTLGCGNIMEGIDPSILRFFLTRTSSTGNHKCAPDTVGQPIDENDIFGCGNIGHSLVDTAPPVPELCNPLTRGSNNDCLSLIDNGVNVWDCSSSDPAKNDGWHEAANVTKTDPDRGGGVLCCKDQCQTDKQCPGNTVCEFHVCVECRDNSQCSGGKTCLGYVCK